MLTPSTFRLGNSQCNSTHLFTRIRVKISQNVEKMSILLLLTLQDEDKFKYGKTKVFFRAGQVALLERLRSDKLKACCILMQKTVRGYLVRKRYTKILNSVKLLQRVSRGYLARR